MAIVLHVPLEEIQVAVRILMREVVLVREVSGGSHEDVTLDVSTG